MVRVAITRRSWPKIMSVVVAAICFSSSPRRRSAAFCMMSGRVEIPMVNVEGTFTRMFCRDSAWRRSISMVIGSSDM